MKYLVLGAQGQLGKALGDILSPEAVRWGREELDLSRSEDIIASKVREVSPDIIINTAAMTDVDACEKNTDLAMRVNAEAPGALARVCKEIGAALMHISTDYVFGSDEMRNSPYVERDIPDPVNSYGHTKYRGELLIEESGCAYLIVRTCGLYGGHGAKPNYVERVLAQAETGAPLRATTDQVFTPTFIGELAEALLRVMNEEKRGVLHLVNPGPVSRFEFTKAVVDIRGLSADIKEAQRKDFSGAMRPAYSALESERIVLSDYMSDWKTALKKYL